MQQIVDYQFEVLDALNIRNSPGHGEVKWFKEEPVLVEVGSRCHGAEGMWMPIATEVYGYNQVKVALDMFLDDNDKTYPQFPTERHGFGAAKFLISFIDTGVLKSFNASCLEEIKKMSSFRAIELFSKKGSKMKKTIDCFTWCGCVLMANKDEAELNKVSMLLATIVSNQVEWTTPFFAHRTLRNPALVCSTTQGSRRCATPERSST